MNTAKQCVRLILAAVGGLSILQPLSAAAQETIRPINGGATRVELATLPLGSGLVAREGKSDSGFGDISVLLSKTYQAPNNDFFQVTNAARARWFALGAQSRLDFRASVSTQAFVRTDAFATEMIKYDYPPLNGRRGVLDLSYGVGGDIAGRGARALVFVSSGRVRQVDPNNLLGDYIITSENPRHDEVIMSSDSHVTTVRLPFVWGQWLFIQVDLAVLAPAQTQLVGNGRSVSDFLGTLVVTGLVATDEDDNPVEGAEITSASGTVYGELGVGTPIAIDVKPGDALATVNVGSNGVTAVAILSSEQFDATTMIDRDSLTFGRIGTEHSFVRCGQDGEDVNLDGLTDLVCRFRTALTDLQPGDSGAILRGDMADGTLFVGSDSVRVIH